ncbi:MAG: NeuD/PglB/VioB family sugar acetyltransferase [Rhodothalassiaceae bacterium]
MSDPANRLERPAVLIGGGGHARVVAAAAQAAGWSLAGAVDPAVAVGQAVAPGVVCLGCDTDLDNERYPVLLMGLGQLPKREHRRKTLFEALRDKGHVFPALVHPRAFIAAEVWLEEGVQLMAGAIIQPGSSIGPNCLINTGACVDHDCKIEGHVHVAPGAVLCGSVLVGAGAFIGAGAVVLPGVRIGAGTVVPAGAVVRADVSEQLRRG